ncbi:hypothetical protein DL771_011719 [Monosporascus sp. 5C6A]|nr:hypothetical protein DL771_011719 [Monosporascus sp. 5C6A]
MDRMLVELITARPAEAQAADEDDSGTTAEKTIRDCLGKKHPNKRQQGELDPARRDYLEIMFKLRKERRE